MNLRRSSGSPAARQIAGPALRVLAAVAAAVAAVALLVFGAQQGLRRMFAGNPRFTMVRMTLRDESGRVQKFLRERGVVDGANLFAFDLRRLRDEFLREAPECSDIRLVRRLPDRLDVETRPRFPVARIPMQNDSDRYADQKGVVFRLDRPPTSLPWLTGCPAESLLPGRTLGGLAPAALELMRLCGERKQLGVEIEGADASHGDHLLVWLKFAGVRRVVKLSWQGMDRPGPESNMQLLQKLGWTVQTMQTPEHAGRTRFDATYPDGVYAE
jgi:hypothetical protein